MKKDLSRNKFINLLHVMVSIGSICFYPKQFHSNIFKLFSNFNICNISYDMFNNFFKKHKLFDWKWKDSFGNILVFRQAFELKIMLSTAVSGHLLMIDLMMKDLTMKDLIIDSLDRSAWYTYWNIYDDVDFIIDILPCVRTDYTV